MEVFSKHLLLTIAVHTRTNKLNWTTYAHLQPNVDQTLEWLSRSITLAIAPPNFHNPLLGIALEPADHGSQKNPPLHLSHGNSPIARNVGRTAYLLMHSRRVPKNRPEKGAREVQYRSIKPSKHIVKGRSQRMAVRTYRPNDNSHDARNWKGDEEYA